MLVEYVSYKKQIANLSTVPTHQVLFQKDGSATTKSLSQEDRNETRENWLTYMPSKSHFAGITYVREVQALIHLVF